MTVIGIYHDFRHSNHYIPNLRFFFKNPLGTILSPIHVLLNCKVSEKSNVWFSRYCVTNERTDGRDSLGLQQLRRETKNAVCSDLFMCL